MFLSLKEFSEKNAFIVFPKNLIVFPKKRTIGIIKKAFTAKNVKMLHMSKEVLVLLESYNQRDNVILTEIFILFILSIFEIK